MLSNSWSVLLLWQPATITAIVMNVW